MLTVITPNIEKNKFDSSGISLQKTFSNKNNKAFWSFRNTGKKQLQKISTANVSINDIFKTQSCFLTTPRNNRTLKLNNDKKKDFVLLTSLYKLPHVENKKSYSKKNLKNIDLNETKKSFVVESNVIDNNSSNLLSFNSSDEKKLFNKKIISKSANKKNINNYYLDEILKDKFYDDVENQVNKKLKNKIFTHDKSIPEKIIKMNQVGEFWKGIFDYCCPLFALKKYRSFRNLQEKKDNLDRHQCYSKNDDFFNINIYKDLKVLRKKPKIYKYENIIEVKRKNKMP